MTEPGLGDWTRLIYIRRAADTGELEPDVSEHKSGSSIMHFIAVLCGVSEAKMYVVAREEEEDEHTTPPSI